MLLLQNEIPEAVNLAAAGAAKKHRARIILNAAPARAISPEFAALADVLVVNRVEAAMLSGLAVETAANAISAAHRLAGAATAVIVTLGGDGLVLLQPGAEPVSLPALPVSVISSHGAGDCFCGALAARLALGHTLAEACDFARTAAGLFVSLPAAEQAGLNTAIVTAQMRSAT